MTEKQKKLLLYGGAGVAGIYVIYRLQSGGSSGSSASAQPAGSAVGPTSSDYAALSGQEQADVAALQQQNQQLLAQEQSDVQGLASSTSGLASQSDLQALAAQEQSDFSSAQSDTAQAIQDAISNLTSQAQDTLGPRFDQIGQEIAALAAGQASLNRALLHEQHRQKSKSRHGGTQDHRRKGKREDMRGGATRTRQHHPHAPTTRHSRKPVNQGGYRRHR